MLYEVSDDFKKLWPLAHEDIEELDEFLEEEVDDFFLGHLLDPLLQSTPLLLVHRGKRDQFEADIYALDEQGDLVVIGLYWHTTFSGSLEHMTCCTEEAEGLGYAELDRMFRECAAGAFGELGLREAHREVFCLRDALDEDQFNRKQRLWIVGSDAHGSLVRSIRTLKREGVPVDFLPFRLYMIQGKFYLDFFSKPYDERVSPSSLKGVIFDTNRSHDENAFRLMVEKKRVSAYGEDKDAVRNLSSADLVFYSHRGVGIVAAALVIGRQVKADGENELYWDVEFLTPMPERFDTEPKAMSFEQVKKVTGKSFYWARTDKRPYLSSDEAQHLLQELKTELAG